MQLTRVTSALARALSVDEVNQIGRDTGQSERLRTVTPHRLLLAIIASLAGAQVESIADLLREFNHQNDVTVAYKAFYNRLARPSFSKFMSQMFARLVERLSLRTLTPEGQTAVARFKDIVIQDGSSFALKKQLRDAFPGRFTTTDPAAVELHATYSGFSDEVSRVQLAPDKEAERQFLPAPSTLKDRLLLADRGTPTSNTSRPFKNTGERSLSASRVPTTHGSMLRGSTASARLCPSWCVYRASSPSTLTDAWISTSNTNAASTGSDSASSCCPATKSR